MKLNMTIISDYLDSQDIKRKQTNRPFSFYLESVEVCTGERFRESCLYIADAEDLPDVPEDLKQYITDLYRKTAGNLQADTLRIPLCGRGDRYHRTVPESSRNLPAVSGH